MPKIHHVFEL